MNIAIDIDGVIRDQTEAFREQYLLEFPEHKDLIKPVTAWEISEFYPIGKDVYKYWFGPWVKACFEDARMFDGAKEFIEILRAAGHKVFILTSQPIRTERYTLAWIDKHSIPHDGILFLNQKGLTRFDMLLDDGEHNLEAVRGNGCTPVCFDQPWNQNWGGLRVTGETERVKYSAFVNLVEFFNAAAVATKEEVK